MSSRLYEPTGRGVNPDRLTEKQRLFVEEYLKDNEFNATQAAIRAGYKHGTAGAKQLANPLVAAAVGKALQERVFECKLEAKQVLKQLAAALYMDPIELFESAGIKGVYKLKSLEDIPPHVRRCITKFKTKTKTYTDEDGNETTDTYMEVEFMSKDACMALAMKHLGLAGGDGPGVNINVGPQILVQLLNEIERDSGQARSNVIDATFIEQKANE